MKKQGEYKGQKYIITTYKDNEKQKWYYEYKLDLMGKKLAQSRKKTTNENFNTEKEAIEMAKERIRYIIDLNIY